MQMINANPTNSGSLAGALPTSASGSFSAGSNLPPRILVMTQQGGMLVVDIEGFQVKSTGFFTVKVTPLPQFFY